MVYKKLFSLLVMFFVLSCSSESSPSLYEFTGIVMTVPYRILIGHPLSDNDIVLITKTIHSVFEEIDRTLNRWNPNSEVSKINRLKAHVPFSISQQMQEFLNRCAYFVALSKGQFDPTIEPLQCYWKGCFEYGMLPSQDVLNELIPTIGWNNIIIKDGTLQKKYDMTGLDFGGIAKGYAVDLMTQRISSLGFTSLYVDWGGEIRTLALHPEGRPWRVYVRDPENQDPINAIAILTLCNESLATSGDYLQKWTLGNKTYTHVIDLGTMQPLMLSENTITSVSVKSQECVVADVIATILMMSKDLEHAKVQAREFMNHQLISECWLKTHANGEITHIPYQN